MGGLLLLALAFGCNLATVVEAQPLSEYDEQEAMLQAYLSVAAYCGQPKTSRASLEAWRCGAACDALPGVAAARQIIGGQDSFAVVARQRGLCRIAFRGTSNYAGWLKDLESVRLVPLIGRGIQCSYQGVPCSVGSGFLVSYAQLRDALVGNLTALGCDPDKVKITVTGHSLGAAQAIIAALDLRNMGYAVEKVYTFGQPRVGNNAFAAVFAREFRLSSTFRITHGKDPVVLLPPERAGFTHGLNEVYYNSSVASGYMVCVGDDDARCSKSNLDIVRLVMDCVKNTKQCDHLSYMSNALGVALDGGSCVDDEPMLV